ncbi:uncharacterized protein N7477_010004 [Penicillium maclennaniae]|uniref:uncharacterized protein n=1 Tax=Penicillium maclennaniae TaxID=1343394 RepID=UPI002541F663|nr:uncharacterized protein N7477_010004 [Penicillium maclennaniae]KAJ5662388.1 hypothetical protein N7477_010004 [Penicillium maclennaniae]
MLENRSHVDFADIQKVTYLLLMCYAVVSTISSIFIGPLADRCSSRKAPLIFSLVLTFVGSAILAISTNLTGLFIGRILQAIGGTAAWIIGFATLRDSIEGKNMGKVFGVVRSFVSLGALSGPAVAGVLLELAGYWITWGSVLFILALDIVIRFLMVEKPLKKGGSSKPENDHDRSSTASRSTDEESPLLPEASCDPKASAQTEEVASVPTASFYRAILLQPRVIIGLLCSTVYSAILASYSTTIPIHVNLAFGWGSLPTGLLFIGLEGPIILASPLYGWLRDKIGTRLPATIGFTLLAPLLWLAGAADQKEFPWATPQSSAEATYIAAIISIGAVTNLMSSVSTIETTYSKVPRLIEQFALKGAVDEAEEKQPGIFGPNGGYNRTYSISTLSFSVGLLVGSLFSGVLTDTVGYYYMNSILGKSAFVLRHSPS